MSNQRSLEDLESSIQSAIDKVGGHKENDLCKFLPVSTGGYMHHFTLRKMKTEQPEELHGMINKFIMRPQAPDRVAPKPRAARGSRKRRDTITLSKGDLEQIRDFMRKSGNQDILSKLSYRRSLASVKRELIASIRKEVIDSDLWNSYVETLNSNVDTEQTPTQSMTLEKLVTIETKAF